MRTESINLFLTVSERAPHVAAFCDSKWGNCKHRYKYPLLKDGCQVCAWQEKGFQNSLALCSVCHSTSRARDPEVVVTGPWPEREDCRGRSGTGHHRHFNLCCSDLLVSVRGGFHSLTLGSQTGSGGWQGGLAGNKQSILRVCYPGGNYCVISPFYSALSFHGVSTALFPSHPWSGDSFSYRDDSRVRTETSTIWGDSDEQKGGERTKRSVIHIPVFLPYLFGVKLFHKSCNGEEIHRASERNGALI